MVKTKNIAYTTSHTQYIHKRAQEKAMAVFHCVSSNKHWWSGKRSFKMNGNTSIYL